MNKHVAAVRLADRDEATEAVELPEELRLSLGAIAGVAREGLLAMCTTVGLAVMGEMMTAEMTAKVSFRRLKGYRQMPTFVAALARHVEAVRAACDAARVA